MELSRIIDLLNERFGTDFKHSDELFFNQIREEAVADKALQPVAAVNPIDNFKYVFYKALEGFFIDRMDQNVVWPVTLHPRPPTWAHIWAPSRGRSQLAISPIVDVGG